MAEFDVSVAVIDWLPAVLSVTVNVSVPSSDGVKVKFAGRPAWTSLLVKSIVPVKPVSVAPLGVMGGDGEAERRPGRLGGWTRSGPACRAGPWVPTSEPTTRLAIGVPRPVT